MEKFRGFRLRRAPVGVFRRVGRRRTAAGRLKAAAQSLWRLGGRVLGKVKRKVGYIRVGSKAVGPPAGYLAVYVGEAEGATCRVVVPVLYFNHPLFATLLREAEMVYGFDHPGGIQIPCRVSEFENVRSRIAATSDASIHHARPWWRLRIKW